MNSWPEVNKKYEKEPEMIAFREWCFKNGFENGGLMISFHKSNIKMIFGLLQCYADTKGIYITIYHYTKTYEYEIWNSNDKTKCGKNYDTLEESMIMCAEKYFN